MSDVWGSRFKGLDNDKHYVVDVRAHHEQLGEREYRQIWSGKALKRLITNPRDRKRIIRLKEHVPS